LELHARGRPPRIHLHAVVQRQSFVDRLSDQRRGARGPEVRDDRSIRILALGDSCTWGWHLDEADAYPSVLQRLLDRRVGAGHFQVLNAGAPGYTSPQGMRFLADRGRTLHPRIVIAGFLWNDAVPGRDAAEELAAPVPPAFLLRVHEFLLLHSHVYRWIQASLPRGDAATRESQRQQPHRVAPELFEENLRHIAALGHQIEAHPVFIDWNAAASGEHRARIARVARELDVPVVTYDGPRFDLIHPTAAGDAALADRILVALTDAGLIEPGPAAVEAPRHTAPRRPSAAPQHSIRVDEHTRAALRATTTYTDALRTGERKVIPMTERKTG
jgi:lysophospholipase L1-like esterase